MCAMTVVSRHRSCATARGSSPSMAAAWAACMRPHVTRAIWSKACWHFYGVGPVTANIFLRELRPFWSKADPDPLPAVKKLARHLSIDLSRYRRKSLTFARVEAGLIRRRHEFASKIALRRDV